MGHSPGQAWLSSRVWKLLAPALVFHLHGLQVREAGARPTRDPAAWFPLIPVEAEPRIKSKQQGPGSRAPRMAASGHSLLPARPWPLQGLPAARFLGTSQSKRGVARSSRPQERRENSRGPGHQGLRSPGQVPGWGSRGYPQSTELEHGLSLRRK